MMRNRVIDGCGVAAPPVHSFESSRAPLLLANLLAHNLLLVTVTVLRFKFNLSGPRGQ